MPRPLQKFFSLCGNKWVILLALYVASHGWLLLNDGYYFDDRTAQGISPAAMMQQHVEEGNPFFGLIAYAFHSLPSMWWTVFLFRLGTFLSMLPIIFFLNAILAEIREIDAEDRYFLTLFFLIIPIDYTRISFFPFGYMLVQTLFYLGFFLITKFLKSRSPVLRVLMWISFLLSFFMNSFLVFYAAVILYLLYAENGHSLKMPLKKAVAISLRHVDVYLLPILFWVGKNALYKIPEWRKGYNIISLSEILKSPFSMILSAFESWDRLFYFTIEAVSWSYFVVFALGLVLFYAWTKAFPGPVSVRPSRHFIFLGWFLYFVGLFPYAAVGKLPTTDIRSDRFQFLLPLGAVFILYYALKSVFNRMGVNSNMRKCALSLVAAAFVLTNAGFYLEYQRDNYKQLALFEHFKESEVVRDNRSFVVTDETEDMNGRGRQYKFYDYGALMRLAFGNASRFVDFRPSVFKSEAKWEVMKNREEFHFKDYAPSYDVAPEYEIRIKHGGYELTRRRLMKMIVTRILRPEDFMKDLKNAIEVKYVKL